MKRVLRCCAVASLITVLSLPIIASAAETENYNKDAANAENVPPMIPHRFTDTSDGNYCLGCHKDGKQGAPITPHPERLSCTGCHGQGEIRDTKPQNQGTK